MLAASVSLFNLIFCWFRFKESLDLSPAAIASRERVRESSIQVPDLAGSRKRSLRVFYLARFLTTVAFVGMEGTFALFCHVRFGLGTTGMGVVFTVIGVVVVCLLGAVGHLSKRYGPYRLALLGTVCMGVSLIGLPFTASMPSLFFFVVLLSIAEGLCLSAYPALISLMVGAHVQGRALGLGQGLNALARAVGPSAAGYLFDHGPDLFRLDSPAAAYVPAGSLCLLASILLASVRAEKSAAQQPAKAEKSH